MRLETAQDYMDFGKTEAFKKYIKARLGYEMSRQNLQASFLNNSPHFTASGIQMACFPMPFISPMKPWTN